MSEIQKVFVMGFAWLVIVIASFSFFLSLSAIYDAQSSKTWPEVKATIVTSEVYKYKSRFCPRILVSYEAEGQTIADRKVSIYKAPCGKIKEAIDKKLLGYEEGKQVALYYKPGKPNQIKLERGSLGTAGYVSVIVTLLFLPGGVLLLRLYKSR